LDVCEVFLIHLSCRSPSQLLKFVQN
jgi:hypothetical protein